MAQTLGFPSRMGVLLRLGLFLVGTWGASPLYDALTSPDKLAEGLCADFQREQSDAPIPPTLCYRDKEEAFFTFFQGSWLERVAISDRPFTWKDGITYSSIHEAMLGDRAALSEPCRNFNVYVNSFLFPTWFEVIVVQKVGSLRWGHYVLTYVRNCLAGNFFYYLTNSIFFYFVYYREPTSNHKRPSPSIILEQMILSSVGLAFYALLPCLVEFMIEQGWTRVYYTVEEIGGWVPCFVNFVLYLSLVEIGVYWVHRTSHTNKFIYRYIHSVHHKYNKSDTLCSWAGVAFHPLDGFQQGVPYLLVLPIVPCHFICSLLLLFLTEIWATYIHNPFDWNLDPFMGSKYHIHHHTHYTCNYGQFFTFCDAIWGTLKVPQEPVHDSLSRKA